MSTIDVPYLIVGAGPVGLTAAHLLANDNRPCLVVERRDGPQRHPAAHVVNARTLEIFRQAGLDMEAIHDLANPPADAGHVNFVTRLNGELIGRLPFERQGPEVLEATPTPLRNISQHRLEPLLAAAADDASMIDLRYDHEWVASDQDERGVTSTIRDRTTGDELTVRSDHVLAADGAGSRVRKSLGIGMVGPPSLQSFIAIYFAATDLRPMIADRLGVLHFVMDPAASGTFIAHDLDREWVFMTSFDPENESVDDYDHERAGAIVRTAIGDTEADIDVVSVGSWHMSAQVSERMRDGRIFLMGDAAHRFPPTGGLGLNTGVADAHGLVWRLGAIADRWADASILDTYEVERRPVAGVNCEQSMTNAFKLATLIEALGIPTDPTTEGVLGRLADPEHTESIAAAVQEQQTHFDMLGLQLGYCYAEGALARDGDPPPPISEPSEFAPSGDVGARLPHAWLDDGRSTLDLVGAGAMTLLSFGEHDKWAASLADADTPVDHVRIGVDAAPTGAWAGQCDVGADGALLVRPDQHVAWRSDSIASPGPAGVHAALERILRAH
ncbi:MAG: FAD-dependent monooxygenase [Actinomycetota bacterium]